MSPRSCLNSSGFLRYCRVGERDIWTKGVICLGSAIVIRPHLKEYLEYWDKQYSIWKLVNRAFICVQYYGLTRLCCWVIDCCLSARLVSADSGPSSVWHSSVNISATRTSFAMILDAYESPTRRLSYVVPFISNFEVFYVKIYRTLQSFHTDNLAIRASLGMRIDACKSSTLKLSHVSKFEPKFALVADLLVFEDRHFTGKTWIHLTWITGPRG